MKPIRTLFLLAASVFVFLQTQPVFAQPASDFTYTVNLGAFVNAQASDFSKVYPFGYVYAEKFQGNLQQIFLGEFSAEQEANALLAQVKAKGYPDAYITRRNLQQGEKVFIIQLGIETVGDQISWRNYSKAGPLFTILNKKQIKIATGDFSNIDEANQRLVIVRKLGFADAFVKEVNNILLHPVSTFEAGGELVAPEVELTVEAPASKTPATKVPEKEVVPVTTTAPPPAPVAVAKAGESKPPAAELIPDSYDDVLAARSPLAQAQVVAMPTIRKEVKRTSALELQKVLKEEGTYSSSLDGLYGKGTNTAMEKWMTENQEVRKYQLLLKYGDQLTSKAAPSNLQNAISKLPELPEISLQTLESSKEPIAKAYRAYYIFATRGAQAEVDNLMNAAIKETFKGQNPGVNAPFDFTATYAYKDAGQLLQHLAYLHSATKDLAVPCWLFQRYPEGATKAFAKAGKYQMENCEQFVKWEPLQLLQSISKDIDPNPAHSHTLLAEAASQRSKMFVSPQELSAEEQKAIEAWNASLWSGLDQWAASDPVHKRKVTPLKANYYQSMVLLEDYFMDKDFKPAQAKGLAMSVLQTVVAPYLESYRK